VSALRLVHLKDNIIYGPVSSRRLGRSLGINVLGAGRKVCTFDCVYCQLRQPRAYPIDYGANADVCRRECHSCRYSQPSPAGNQPDLELPDVAAITASVADAVKANPAFDSLTLSGNGEATLFPQFGELVDGLIAVRDTLCPGAPITLLSNASTAARLPVRQALRRLDVRVMKLDAGTPATLRRFNRPCPGVDFDEMVEGLRALAPIVLQTMFAAGPAGNSEPADVEAWLNAVERVGPARMQIYSLDRVPAESTVAVVPRDRLREIAAEVAAHLAVDVAVY
jgi:wyosine [tRNA(Phe)-imidazoG37] synthetase (radical SAM superfamily)